MVDVGSEWCHQGLRSRVAAVACLLMATLAASGHIASGQAGQQRGTTIDAPKAHGQGGSYYALVIGINRYQAPLPALKTAVHDAEAIATILNQRYGFEVKLLTDGNATRDNILGAMDVYRRTLRDGDSLLVYYAGHGYADNEEDKSYWLPVDAEQDTSSHWISADDLTNRMRAEPAKHVLVVSDSCYSGGLTREGGIQVRPADQQVYLRKMLVGRSRTLMSSGGNEPVADGGADGHSVFANAVLHALEQSEAREFTGGDLFHDFVLRQVAGGSDQVPRYSSLRNSGDDAGDFVFRKAGEVTVERPESRPPFAVPSDVQLQAELMVWTSVKDLKQPALLQDYLRQYPNGRFSAVARAMLEGLRAGEATAHAEPPSPRAPNVAASLSVAKRGIALFEANQFGDALPLLRTAAQQGDADAEAFACRMYSKGWGVERDFNTALKLCESSANKGNANGEAFLGAMYALGQGVAKDYPAALRLGQQSTEKGNAYGANLLGAIYSNGFAVTKDQAKAADYFRKSADQGNAYGSANLGESYLYGTGVEKDEAEGMRRCRPSAEAGNEVGELCLGIIYEEGHGVAKDPAEAAKWYRKSADLGDVGAQEDLAYLYANGTGVTKDAAQAVYWFRKAAEQNDAAGETALGGMYSDGSGVAKDVVEAEKWYRKAAEQGYADGEVHLADLLNNSASKAETHAEALTWYLKAAEQGNSNAQYDLGTIYGGGDGVTINQAEALKWYTKWAEQGDPKRAAIIGSFYEYGMNLNSSETEAMKWYSRAAEQGDAMGEVGAGQLYRDGKGTTKDPTTAAKLFRKAADQDDEDGEYYLGQMYEKGSGVAKNLGVALYWYDKAAAHGDSVFATFGIGGLSSAGQAKTSADALRKKKVAPVTPQ